MRILSRSLLSVVLVALLQGLSPAQNPIRAKTDAGKEVLLYSNGTWKYAEEKKAAATPNNVHSKPASAQTVFKTARGSFEVWMDENKWSKTADEPGRVTFKLKTGDAYAMLISEEIGIGTASLKELAIENAKQGGSDFALVSEDKRIVNGREVTSMRFNVTVRTIQFTYYGYYYGGKEGAIQVLCFTGQNLFDKYERDITDFLNGLTVP